MAPSAVLSPRRALGVAAVGTFMATLDSSIVNIALPTVARDLGAGTTAVQWVQLAYSLVVTSLLLTAGRVADLVGRRRVYVSGLLVFTAASLLCGAAPSAGALVAARAAQAVGAAMVMANGPAIVAWAFEPGRRGRALAVISVTVSVGLVTGNAIGGLLAEFFSWRSVFLVNVPVGLAAAAVGWRVLAPLDARPAEPAERAVRDPGPAASARTLRTRLASLDWPGALASGAGLGALLLALSAGAGRAALAAALLGLSAGAFGWFVARQRRAPEPLLDLRLFRNPTFRSANAASLLAFTATVAVNFLVPFYLVGTLGRSPAEAGLVYLTSPVCLTLLAPAGGRLADRVGSRGPAVAGLALLAGGLFALSMLGRAASTADVVWRLALVGAGHGLFQTPNNTALLSSVPRERLGVASGMQATMRNLGFALGVALAGAVVAAWGGALADPTLLLGFGPALRVSAGLALAALVISAMRPGDACRDGAAEGGGTIRGPLGAGGGTEAR